MKRINNDNSTTELKRGESVFTWSDWKSPDDIDVDSLPELAGVYMLRAVDPDGNPYRYSKFRHNLVKGEVRLRDCETDGVVYIGKAESQATIKERVGKLVASWKTGCTRQPQSCHTSRQNFLNDNEAQKLLAGKEFQVRYQPLPTDSSELNLFEQEQAKKEGLSDKEWRKKYRTRNQSNASVRAVEASMMGKFQQETGDDMPLLNRRNERRGDVKYSDEELDAHVEKLEAVDEFIKRPRSVFLNVDSPAYDSDKQVK